MANSDNCPLLMVNTERFFVWHCQSSSLVHVYISPKGSASSVYRKPGSVSCSFISMLRLHLSNYHLTTTGTKAVMARRLFDVIHTVSSISTTSPTNLLTSSATMTTSNSQSSPGYVLSSSSPSTSTLPSAINPAQLSTLLQLLSQTLQQNPFLMTQQTSTPASLPPHPSISSTPMFPANSPPVFSVAQHGSATTLPTSLTSTITHAPPLRPQETNEDVLSTASDIPLAAGGHIDPSVSLLLPPVPSAVQQRILKGEFIDFNSLLPEVMFSTANTTPSTNASCSTVQPTRITSFSS